jgi:hypothetical protein
MASVGDGNNGNDFRDKIIISMINGESRDEIRQFNLQINRWRGAATSRHQLLVAEEMPDEIFNVDLKRRPNCTGR